MKFSLYLFTTSALGRIGRWCIIYSCRRQVLSPCLNSHVHLYFLISFEVNFMGNHKHSVCVIAKTRGCFFLSETLPTQLPLQFSLPLLMVHMHIYLARLWGYKGTNLDLFLIMFLVPNRVGTGWGELGKIQGGPCMSFNFESLPATSHSFFLDCLYDKRNFLWLS
jgi:hypothetical protein